MSAKHVVVTGAGGISDQFYGPHDDIPLPRKEDGIDFEGEFGVITDRVPYSGRVSIGGVALVIEIDNNRAPDPRRE
jgi:fumarylacetoacetate (FAA) hydrolase